MFRYWVAYRLRRLADWINRPYPRDEPLNDFLKRMKTVTPPYRSDEFDRLQHFIRTGKDLYA